MSLSILTRPIVDLQRLPKSLQAPIRAGSKHVVRQASRWMLNPRSNLVSRYGHSAVTDSLLSGLRVSGQSFRYNPLVGNYLTLRVGVLAGAATLASVLDAAHSSRVAIMAGPNITTAPSEIAHLYIDGRVKLVLVPSAGVARAYEEDLPEIAHKVRVWPAGIDTEYWSPALPTLGIPQVLLYIKNDWSQIAEELATVLKKSGFRVTTIRYGRYSRRQYRAALQGSVALVYLGTTESQGIAQFEAWACNVPTFVRALPGSVSIGHQLPNIKGATNLSAAPYLSHQTGDFWTGVEECVTRICNAGSFGESPRRWVLAEASLHRAAANYLSLARGLTIT